MDRPVIIYHADCPDGMSGGWAAWKKFGNRATYIPSHHQNPPPKGLKGRTVYIVDFSYPLPIMRTLVANAERVIAIDHHRMAEPSANLATEKRFDNNHSGAVLAWHYFHPTKPVPHFLRYVEDLDLWRFRLPNSKAVSNLIGSITRDFKTWDRMVEKFESPKNRKRLIKKGKIMLEYEQNLIGRILAKAVFISWKGKQYAAVNSPILVSELGHELSKKSKTGIGIVWHRSPQGIKVSLRSEGNIDATRLSIPYGGGGHRNAAAFVIKNTDRLPWKIIS